MTELETNINDIMVEKEQKIIPENIKKGVNILGVTGTLEAKTALKENIKQFTTLEEAYLDVSEDLTDDMTGLVYDKTWHKFTETPKNNNYKLRQAVLQFSESNPKPTEGTYFGNFDFRENGNRISMFCVNPQKPYMLEWEQDINDPNKYNPIFNTIRNYDSEFKAVQEFMEYSYRNVEIILSTNKQNISNLYYSTVKKISVNGR